MKNIYNITVYVGDSAKMESTLGAFRIGMNDWAKTRVLDWNGSKIISYTVLCDENTFESIMNIMNRQ